MSAIATVRQIAVVAAMRPDAQLIELPRLAVRTPVPATLSERARVLSQAVADPAIFSTRFAECDIAGAEPGTWDDVATACLALIDKALATAPTSGELWLFRAQVLAETGTFNQALVDALSNSYKTAPREAWIAIDRVMLGLRVFGVLSPDVQVHVVADLRHILTHYAWSHPLAAIYARDESLRLSAAAAIDQLPAAEIERFVGWVRLELR